MTGWWNTRTPREKMLLAIAGFILAVAVIWQLVLNPAIHTLERAKRSHEQSAQTLARLDRIESLMQQGETILPYATAPSTQDTAALLSEAERMAREGNLLLSGSEPASPSSFRVKLSAVSGPAFFQWVEQVETGLGVSVSAASLTQNADGSMDADTEFSLDGVS
ncbi:general secretion pathway protein M [Hyphomonas neptunium ATCC 15444]|uniref:General secretion pathway protein M n=2 Tax=Hyphomonas TaxID=85 RepID=Q0C118_HYPNA|nr:MULTISPECIES: type II secretion system protein GspM [Hyphomonas]ABI77812.1 general secretion pathway protein M [Hyphomonas neptunium ATCC 15444]KCZ95010.1 general secretion pathway protein M [Hyphomonas hirschiana VP5]